MTTKHAPLAAYVETVPGLEEVAWLEVRRRFPQARFSQFLFARDERGIAAFEAPATAAELFSLRTASALFLTAAHMPKTSRGFRDLHRLREQMAGSGDVGRAVNAYNRYQRRQVHSYRLIVRTYGKHEYGRQAVRRAVIQAIEQLYPHWKRVQDDPDVELWANVLGSSILVGLRLSASRDPAPGEAAPGALPASVAAALALLTDPQDDDRFFDPFFENGAIVSARRDYAARLLISGSPTCPEPAAGQTSTLLACWDAARLPLPAGALDKAATRFPLLPDSTVTAHYVAWLQELQRVLQPGGQAVVLTRAFEAFKDAIRETPDLEIRSGYSVTVSGEWGRIYLLQRK